MSGAKNVKGGLVLIAVSLVGGLAMSIFAFEPMAAPPPGFETYDALPRRLMRLAHVAAIMLPLLNVAFGLLIDRLHLSPLPREAASLALLFGGVGLPLSLATEALVPAARAWHLAGPPAVAFVLGTCVVAWGACRTSARRLTALE